MISFRAGETLTSFFPNPGNSIGMLQFKQTGAGSTSLAEREVSQGPIRHMDTQTSTYTAGKALRSTLTAMNPDLGPLSRSRYPLHGADSAQSVQSSPTSNTSCDGFNLRADAMGESATRMEGKTFTTFLPWTPPRMIGQDGFNGNHPSYRGALGPSSLRAWPHRCHQSV